jgi:hypothetical protein
MNTSHRSAPYERRYHALSNWSNAPLQRSPIAVDQTGQRYAERRIALGVSVRRAQLIADARLQGFNFQLLSSLLAVPKLPSW